MAKIKTNKAAAKRFKSTGTGKIRRWHAFKSHILTKKSKKRKRHLRQDAAVPADIMKQMKRLLPYGA
ncbi:MAG TPA: 50S ribosomal protein L35 [bacterium]|nr:50S ribosomal protein L35 [bacterium]HSA32943.1 50S ribosomal protein L35 [bacterium]